MAVKNSALARKLVQIFVFLKKRKLVFLKKMKLLEQYSYYSHVKEYQFSPSSTPRRMSRMSLKKLYAKMLVICRCFLGNRKSEMYRLEMGLDSMGFAQELPALESCEDDESVDERAERFIQSFYQQMRHQSSFQLLLEI